MQSQNNSLTILSLADCPHVSVVIEDCYAPEAAPPGPRQPIGTEEFDINAKHLPAGANSQGLIEASLSNNWEDKAMSYIGAQDISLARRRPPSDCEMSRAVRSLDENRWLSCDIGRNPNALEHLSLRSAYGSLEQQLHQSQKLESLGHLAAGIAHEINNPMQYISDNIQFMKASLVELRPTLDLLRQVQRQPNNEELVRRLLEQISGLNVERMLEHLPEAVEDVEQGIGHVSRIVRAMKEFSHPGTETQLPVNLNHVLESTLVISKSEWKYVAEVEVSLQNDLPKVAGFAVELHQVFLNLLVNAAHAIASANAATGRKKGLIRVSTLHTGDYCTVSIEDNGCGIPREIQHRLFDPFFTTKEVGKGTGQGLPIARRVVVDKHGGRLWFDSVVGRGTTFYVQLPRGRSPMA